MFDKEAEVVACPNYGADQATTIETAAARARATRAIHENIIAHTCRGNCARTFLSYIAHV
jgi:hypothetical protein